MAQLGSFTYEGIHTLLAFEIRKSPSLRPQHSPLCPTLDSPSNSPNQKLGFRRFIPDLITQQQQDLASSSCSSSSSSSSKPHDTNSSRRLRKGPYKKYTTEQKRLAIDMINSGKDIKTVSREYNIPRRNLLRWRKNGCERKEGGGRPSDFVMEEKLFEKILRKEVANEKQIRQLALGMTNFKKFKASKGWYVKFWRRFNQYKARIGRDAARKVDQEQ